MRSHYSDVIMSKMAFQITCVSIVYSNICSEVDQRKPQSSASLAFVWGIHRWPVNSLHKRPVTRNMFPFDDVIIQYEVWSFWPNIRFTRQYRLVLIVDDGDISPSAFCCHLNAFDIWKNPYTREKYIPTGKISELENRGALSRNK